VISTNTITSDERKRTDEENNQGSPPRKIKKISCTDALVLSKGTSNIYENRGTLCVHQSKKDNETS
jgi:hypothetical protein